MQYKMYKNGQFLRIFWGISWAFIKKTIYRNSIYSCLKCTYHSRNNLFLLFPFPLVTVSLTLLSLTLLPLTGLFSLTGLTFFLLLQIHKSLSYTNTSQIFMILCSTYIDTQTQQTTSVVQLLNIHSHLLHQLQPQMTFLLMRLALEGHLEQVRLFSSFWLLHQLAQAV